MGKAIVKVKDKYAEWSTVVDAPTSYFVNRDEAVRQWGAERIERCDEFGDSMRGFAPGEPNDYRIGPEFNRAGPNEECLTLDGLLAFYENEDSDERYCREGIPSDWIVIQEGGFHRRNEA